MTVRLEAGQIKELSAALTPIEALIYLHGTVVDEETGEPLAEVSVRSSANVEDPSIGWSAITDSSGYYSLANGTMPHYDVFTFEKEGYYSKNLSIDLVAGDNVLDCQLAKIPIYPPPEGCYPVILGLRVEPTAVPKYEWTQFWVTWRNDGSEYGACHFTIEFGPYSLLGTTDYLYPGQERETFVRGVEMPAEPGIYDVTIRAKTKLYEESATFPEALIVLAPITGRATAKIISVDYSPKPVPYMGAMTLTVILQNIGTEPGYMTGRYHIEGIIGFRGIGYGKYEAGEIRESSYTIDPVDPYPSTGLTSGIFPGRLDAYSYIDTKRRDYPDDRLEFTVEVV